MSGAGRPRAGSYGLDAPRLLAIPVLLIAAAIAEGILEGTPWPFLGAAAILLLSGLGLQASLAGKFAVWDRELDRLDLMGDERVLDLGCGRGAVLALAARRVPRGRAVGVDLWRAGDQTRNAPARTLANARAEGVADHVEVLTGDLVDLPLESGSFDLVISNVAIHNLHSSAKRRAAIDEAARVTAPGGRVALADLRHTGEYRDRLEELGMEDVSRRDLGWRMWWSGPWLATHLVSARKPAAAGD